jgi:alpha-tubulin suppressor-like RCC1 family protein
MEEFLVKPVCFTYFQKNQLKVLDVSLGDSHILTVAKQKDGTETEMGDIYSWGLDLYGRLGFNPLKFENIYDLIMAKEVKYEIIRIPIKLNLPEKISRVCCGPDYSSCLTISGKIYTWGFNKYGNLGLGDTLKNDNNFDLNNYDEKKNNKDKKSDYNSVKSKKPENNLFNQDEELFEENEMFVKYPQIVKGLIDKKIIQISCGNKHMLVLSEERRAYSWGCGDFGVLGISSFESVSYPVLIKSLSKEDLVFVACGETTSAAINSFGSVYSWGSGKYGKLGNGTYSDYNFPFKIDDPTLNNQKIFYISLGPYHTVCASCK